MCLCECVCHTLLQQITLAKQAVEANGLRPVDVQFLGICIANSFSCPTMCVCVWCYVWCPYVCTEPITNATGANEFVRRLIQLDPDVVFLDGFQTSGSHYFSFSPSVAVFDLLFTAVRVVFCRAALSCAAFLAALIAALLLRMCMQCCCLSS